MVKAKTAIKVKNEETVEKAAFQATLEKMMSEHKDWFLEVVQELLEDHYLGKAMKEADKKDYVSKEEVFAVLRNIK